MLVYSANYIISYSNIEGRTLIAHNVNIKILIHIFIIHDPHFREDDKERVEDDETSIFLSPNYLN